ncbi:methylamine methyltransferase corrinoid protein reductive activase [uncultured Clostridium sp.]|nr:methylamine methyltransferase corrinoid protein reductive activase [uncultured Clostridium sp.]
MECEKGSDVYRNLEKEFEELLPVLYGLAEPTAVYRRGKIPEGSAAVQTLGAAADVIYVLAGTGERVSEEADRLFASGDCVKGLLLHAMADEYLFRLDEQMQDEILEYCREEGIGIGERLEAPVCLPAEFQKELLEAVRCRETEKIRLTKGYMFEPVKTMGYLLKVSPDQSRMRIRHDCNTCEAVNCRMKDKCIMNCAACRRTDCRMRGQWKQEEDFDIVQEYERREQGGRAASGEACVIAADIGTTTLVLQLVGAVSHEILGSYSSINHQRRFGADVVSRIQASVSGQGKALAESIREDLRQGIQKLMEDQGVTAGRISKIGIAGNTTMLHLLMEYPCRTLGTSPFRPYHNELQVIKCRDLFRTTSESSNQDGKFPPADCPVILLPGISAFVGADITAGLYACGIHEAKKPVLFLDLGTNGEMAIGTGERLFVTSTAAGPAFEGGNITCGTGSVPGAVCRVTIGPDRKAIIKTIGDRPPIGICGTGLIEGIAELYRTGLIDETGLLAPEYFETGYPLTQEEQEGQPPSLVITQNDIREIQMAKAAIRAGLETLTAVCTIPVEEIDAMYVAGGFGYRLDLGKAAAIGLIPPLLVSRAKAVGNSSLSGVTKYMLEAGSIPSHIAKQAREVQLADSETFRQLYLTYMYFPGKNSRESDQ